MNLALPKGSKYGVWGFAAGAAVTMFIGFNWGGWTTAGTTEKLIYGASRTAVTNALVPYCVEAAMREPEKLAGFPKGDEIYRQRSYISENTTWATKKGERSADYELASGCAAALVKQQIAATKAG